MRKVLILAAVTFLAIAGFSIFRKTAKEPKPVGRKPRDLTKVTPSPTQKENGDFDAKPGKDGYTFNWLIVRDKESVSLHSNLQERLTSSDAKNKNGCLHLISGGFYTKENQHAGLFIAGGEKLSDSRSSPLFNAYFSINFEGHAEISKSAPDSLRVALQAGPILLEEKEPVSLSLENDNQARRVVVATTRDGNIVYLVIYNKNSVFAGPLLSEVPQLLKNINENTNLDIIDALNLDGGTASAFISGAVNLEELSRLGSFFCVKEGLILY